jgi:signal transduction histidine kinase
MIASLWSLRTRLVLIVLLTGIAPLAIVGVSLAHSITRSGEDLLRSRLEESLGRLARGIGARWVASRADLLTIAEHEAVRAALTHPAADAERLAVELAALTPRLHDVVQSVSLRQPDGQRSWPVISGSEGEDAGVSASFDVFERPMGRRIGVVDARMRLTSLVPSNTTWTAGAGAVLALIDPSAGASLLPLPFDAQLVKQDRFEWAGEQWMVVRQRLHEPAIELVAAAPILAFAQPFAAARRQGVVALTVVAAFATILTIVLTRETTRSLRALSEAADNIARGAYGATVDVREGDEVGRVARAFNKMSVNLRRTLEQLAERQSLAAVGEFAAGLAHEVRNPLTAIRIDLQRLEEKADQPSAVRESAARALRTVSRLDATVTGALRVARGGHAGMENIDLRVPLQSAVHEASPETRARSIELRTHVGSEVLLVRGDNGALHQLFLNLLLNAAQATPANGHIEISVARVTPLVEIRIADTGPGISPSVRELVFAPLYSTKAEGTGLGLAIARRIAVAHGGALAVEESTHPGAVLLVTLPLLEA